MIRILITAEAYGAICAGLKPGVHGLKPTQRSSDGGFFVWMPRTVRGMLDLNRQRGESYSDVIIRLAGME